MSLHYTAIQGHLGIDPQLPCVSMGGKPCSPCLQDMELQSQIEEQSLSTQLEIKRHVLRMHINANHDRFIHKLPLELACHIFVLTLPTYELKTLGGRDAREANYATLSLGAVCRKWRQIAWSTPRLWSTLSIYVTSHLLKMGTFLSEFTSDC